MKSLEVGALLLGGYCLGGLTMLGLFARSWIRDMRANFAAGARYGIKLQQQAILSNIISNTSRDNMEVPRA